MRLLSTLGHLFAGASLVAVLSAQTPPAATEMSAKDAPITFAVRTNLVLVPVVVRDRQGKTVGNLRQEDFQLSDKGKPQIVSKFSIENTRTPKIIPLADQGAEGLVEEKPGVASEAVARHFVAYLFDDLHSKPEDLMIARAAAGKHIARSLDPATRAAIYTTSGQTVAEFTSDLATLHTALLKIQSRKPPSASDCPQVGYYLADTIQNRNDTTARAALVAETIQCLSVDASTADGMVDNAVRRELTIGEQQSRLALISTREIVRRMSTAPGSRSIILASSGFYLTPSLRADETQLMDRAIRANVTISSLDARGLYGPPGFDASQRSPSFASLNLRMRVQQEEASANSDVLAELASATGGRFVQNTNALEEGFDRLAQQPEFIYVLGFSPQNLKLDGAYHSLKVAVRESKGLDVQARRGYFAPNHARDPVEKAREEVREAIFSLEETNDLPVTLNLQFFKSADYAARLTVLAKLDLKPLRFRKVEDRNLDTLTVVAAVFDQNGNFVKGAQKTLEMRLRDETLTGLLASGVSVRNVLDVTPGRYVVRLVVRDSEGEMMASRNGAIVIP